MKALRVREGISINLLSQKTGLSRPTIRNIEKGKSAWNVDTEILYLGVLQHSAIEGYIELSSENGVVSSIKITGISLISKIKSMGNS